MGTMTVFYDDPFWVAVLEIQDRDGVHATRHVLGSEPTNAELYQFLLRHGTALLARAQRSAARADEILGLDVPDLDMEFRRALVVEKGGDRAYVHWETLTARLLPRLLQGRITGPVFLADRRAPTGGRRAQALADIDPDTGRGRLSYPRAEYLFKQACTLHDPHDAGWTLHQLRHSGLTHLAARGRTAAELQAKSRHRQLATLGIYVHLGEDIAARITAENDATNRRRRR
ncbi:hypothetical protein Acy02nite_49110 [Actinoplanes cyaneus]|uniref:Tyr recombinase domain-containing protein n=1 Tax=Actinoplanes cyaneus TaxID=52696 RepID=A0A919IS28_9ACTN|nr:DUF2992 family protein [Actinoplanes cyaneus]MCW2143193.1 Phage integrase family protein [Actinoplanes cyaneus]GID67030.1 hypothetical protein Acy02nite_49110 [Actinoplanes cyaneus]